MFNKSIAPISIWRGFKYSHLAVIMRVIINAWKVSKYGPEKTPYFDPSRNDSN